MMKEIGITKLKRPRQLLRRKCNRVLKKKNTQVLRKLNLKFVLMKNTIAKHECTVDDDRNPAIAHALVYRSQQSTDEENLSSYIYVRQFESL